ncbi:MAG: HDIG domain-containing protein [Phycisphaerales bacterium]|nr:HDIG domain-containing protein [Phycisphaerales bacterium]
MAKDSSKSTSKTGSKTGPKNGSRSSQSSRRSTVQVSNTSVRQQLADLIASPNLFWGTIALIGFVLIVGSVTNWTRGQLLVSVGQVMHETRTSRVEFNTEDVQQTQMNRQAARLNVPRIHNADLPVLEEIRASLANLPRTLGGVASLDEVDRDIRIRFGLNEEAFQTLRQTAAQEASLKLWTDQVNTLDEILRRRPLLDRQTWQRATQEGLNTQIELRYGPAEEGIQAPARISRDDVINIDNTDQFTNEIQRMIRIAGFASPVDSVVLSRLSYQARPTFAYDESVTAATQETAAERVLPVRRSITVGQRIYARGDVLEQASYELAKTEIEQFTKQGSVPRRLLKFLSIYGMVAMLGIVLAGYITIYSKKIARRPARTGWLTAMIAACVIAACVLSVFDPRLMWLASITPVLLVAILVCIAYDQRTALAICGVTAIIIGFALKMHIGMFILMLVGSAIAIAQLKEIRDRRTIIRMSLVVAAVLAALAVLDQLIILPTIGVGGASIARPLIGVSAQAGISGMLAGGIALFILPFIENVFDISTGMTLIELRDPKQPLLRELQQRAPGTYNHSLNVASIAESAAESIGADALLTYVGCLYHDIGKMNKPDYFIENQSGGANKHDKLNPAMSLLVIVGHVKDGVEMARENGLPKSLHHFIDAHHGTTLVEYFYRRAKEQASHADEDRSVEQIMKDNAEEQLPDEVDYRYPGPKPQTKEVAIVMLADAIESATRTLTEPTPARIDALVRSLANKRLMDGQFDECNLTFRELKTICDSISKTVASIYHGRIRYSADAEDSKSTKETKPAETKSDKSA